MTHTKTVKKTVRCIVADDHPIFLEGLKRLLTKHPSLDIEIIGEARDGSSLWYQLQVKKADLLILDLNMPDKDGLEILEDFPALQHQPKTVVLSMYDDDKIVKQAFRAGANGYVLKQERMDELFMAMEKVLAGKTFEGTGTRVSDSDWAPTSEEEAFRDTFVQRYHLTKRETEILGLISQALTNKQIAKKLYISDQTVSVHRKNIMRKLNVNNTASLIKLVYDNSLV